jgi:hypothetical protein
LIHHRFDDLRVAMADVEDAEAAQAIEVLSPVHVAVRVRSGVGPLDHRARTLDVAGFAVLEKPRVDVLAETVDGLARDPTRVLGRDLRLGDEVEDGLRVL